MTAKGVGYRRGLSKNFAFEGDRLVRCLTFPLPRQATQKPPEAGRVRLPFGPLHFLHPPFAGRGGNGGGESLVLVHKRRIIWIPSASFVTLTIKIHGFLIQARDIISPETRRNMVR